MLAYLPVCLLMADGIATFLMLVVTGVIVTILVVNHLDVIGRCFCHVVIYGHLNMADDVVIAADGMATFFVVIVADGKDTV